MSGLDSSQAIMEYFLAGGTPHPDRDGVQLCERLCPWIACAIFNVLPHSFLSFAISVSSRIDFPALDLSDRLDPR